MKDYILNIFFVLIHQEAKEVCMANGLEDTVLNNCVFDVLMTNDTSFADQQSLKIGKKFMFKCNMSIEYINDKN